jgi:hypothetical protein
MKSTRSRILIGCSIFLLAASAASAQKRPVRQTATAYDLSRETLLEGTVLSFTEAPATPPVGARVTVQTTSGAVDVLLGPPSFLKASQFMLAPGDSVKIAAARVQLRPDPSGQRPAGVFVARVIQKGNQSLVLRSPRGSPLWLAGARALPPAQRAQLAQKAGAR